MRTLGVLVLLAAAAAYVVLHPPENLAVGRGILRACPVDLEAWSGSELSFEDAVLEELRADDVLVRRYERGKRVVWLTIVHHENRRYGAHDPQLCYESQGYVVQPLGRRGVGVELKASYYRQAARNVQAAAEGRRADAENMTLSLDNDADAELME